MTTSTATRTLRQMLSAKSVLDTVRMYGADCRILANDYSLELEELPAKGKKTLRHFSLNTHHALRVLHLDAYYIENLGDASETDTFDAIVARFDVGLKAATRLPYPGAICRSLTTESALKVAPRGAEPMTVQLADTELKVSWSEFKAYSPGSTMSYASDGEPHYSLYSQSSAGAARKLYKLVQARGAASFATMSWKAFCELLRAEKISAKYSASQWS